MLLKDVMDSEIKGMLDNLVAHGKECAAQEKETKRPPQKVYIRGRKVIMRVTKRKEG